MSAMQHSSKKNDLKAFKLGVGNDLWYDLKMLWFLGVERSKVKVTESISEFLYVYVNAHLTDNSNTVWV